MHSEKLLVYSFQPGKSFGGLARVLQSSPQQNCLLTYQHRIMLGCLYLFLLLFIVIYCDNYDTRCDPLIERGSVLFLSNREIQYYLSAQTKRRGCNVHVRKRFLCLFGDTCCDPLIERVSVLFLSNREIQYYL